MINKLYQPCGKNVELEVGKLKNKNKKIVFNLKLIWVIEIFFVSFIIFSYKYGPKNVYYCKAYIYKFIN